MSALFAATYPGADAALVIDGLLRARGCGARLSDRRRRSRTWLRRPRSGACPPRARFLAERAPSVADDEEAIRWYASYLVRGASPGAAAQITRHERGDRRPARAADDPASPTLVLYRERRVPARGDALHGRAHAGRARRRAARARPPAVGGRPGGRAATRSRRSSPRRRPRPSPTGSSPPCCTPRVPDARAPLLRGLSPASAATELPAAAGRAARELRRARAGGPLRAGARRPRPRAGRRGVGRAAHRRVRASTATSSPAPPVELAAASRPSRRPGEVLATSTVRDLVAGSGMEFTERGTVRLPVRDVPPEWRLYEAVTGAITGAVTGA